MRTVGRLPDDVPPDGNGTGAAFATGHAAAPDAAAAGEAAALAAAALAAAVAAALEAAGAVPVATVGDGVAAEEQAPRITISVASAARMRVLRTGFLLCISPGPRRRAPVDPLRCVP